jgi:DNA-binding SARP family transcriptional activator
MSRATALVKGLAALAALAVMATGIPWALVHFIGWPLPHALPTWTQLRVGLTQHGIPDTTLLKALACVVWAAWALLVISLAVETPAALRGRMSPRIRAAGPVQPMVANLLAAVAIAALSLTARPQPAPRPLHVSLQPANTSLTPALAIAAVAAPTPIQLDASPPAQPPPETERISYAVQRNDTLWGIAQERLGDPLRWREIFALNQGRPQPDGSALTDPHWIRPGWTLLLPTQIPSATPPAGPTSPVRPSAQPAPSEPSTATPTSVPITEPAAPSTQRPVVAAPIQANANHSPSGSTNGSHAHGTQRVSPVAVSLPDGAVVSGAFAAGILSAVAVGRLRRRHGHQPGDPKPGRCLAAPALGPTIRRLASALSADDEAPPAPDIPTHDDAEQARAVPDLIDLAERVGAPITARLADVSGLSLAGPDADDVARSWLAALLTRAGPLGAEVLANAATLERLLPGLGDTPGLRPAADSGSLVRALEAEILSRTRVLDAAEATDDVSYRRAHPAEPLPALLCLADDLDANLQARLAANLTAVPRLGITVVFLADTPVSTARLHLDGRTVTGVEPTERIGWLAGASLFTLPAPDAADVLRALAAAEFRPTSDADPEWTEVIERMEHPAPPSEPWPEPQPAPGEAAERPVRVEVFGPLTITVGGAVISRGLRSVAKELLLYYLLRPEGATVEQAVEHLWPDTDAKLVHRQFWTAASNLRSRLRQHLGADVESKILDQAGEVYRLDRDVVGADLWDFQTALSSAARAGDDSDALAALRRAVEAYRGDLAETSGWIWLEPVREDLHRRAVDAHLRLAELEDAAGDTAAAQAVLEKLIDLDRYAEEPYRRLMSLQAGQGRPDAVKATWRQLQRRLIEIDLDPDPATARLYRILVAEEPAA